MLVNWSIMKMHFFYKMLYESLRDFGGKTAVGNQCNQPEDNHDNRFSYIISYVLELDSEIIAWLNIDLFQFSENKVRP